MALTLKTTYTKSLRVAQVLGSGATNLLPTPNDIVSGSTSAVGSNTLVDTTKNFITLGVKVGDLVVATASGTICPITGVAATTLTLNDGTFNSAGVAYTIYSQTDPGTVSPYRGAVLYNCLGSATGNVTVTTLDGYSLNVIIPAGQICPIQVVNVTAVAGVTWGQLIALW